MVTITETALKSLIIDEFEKKQLERCMRCGLCMPHCPTYRLEWEEMNSPRGRTALMAALAEGKAEDSDKLIGFINMCLDCRACQTYCPAGVKVGEAVLSTRTYIESRRPQGLIKKIVLQQLLAKPELLETLSWPVYVYRLLGLSTLVRQSGVLGFVSTKLDTMERLLPQFQGPPLRRTIEERLPAIGEQKMTVLFFLGCAMSLVLPGASKNTVELLRKAGCEVITPKEIKCCGAPHLNEGDRETALRLARSNIYLFEKFAYDFIVTDCAACGAELKKYPELFPRQDEYRAKAEKFAAKIRDISELLTKLELKAENFSPLKKRVTYHDPCHLVHGQGICSQPRELIKMIPEIEFVELPESDRCCGSAGSYAITHTPESLEILGVKLNNVQKIAPEILVTSNPGCLLQLAMGCYKKNLEIDVKYLTELLNESYVV